MDSTMKEKSDGSNSGFGSGDLSFTKNHTSGISKPETPVSHQVSSAGRSSEIPEDHIKA